MDIKVVDGFAWVQNHSDRFFRSDKPAGWELAGHLICDAVYRRVECCVALHRDWWIVYGQEDWLSGLEHEPRELFRRIVPAPEQGPNSMRGEVIVAAFAARFATFNGSDWEVGVVPDAISKFVASKGAVARAVAFQPPV